MKTIAAVTLLALLVLAAAATAEQTLQTNRKAFSKSISPLEDKILAQTTQAKDEVTVPQESEQHLQAPRSRRTKRVALPYKSPFHFIKKLHTIKQFISDVIIVFPSELKYYFNIKEKPTKPKSWKEYKALSNEEQKEVYKAYTPLFEVRDLVPFLP